MPGELLMYDFPMVNVKSNANIDIDYVFFSPDLAEVLDIDKMDSINIIVGKHRRKLIPAFQTMPGIICYELESRYYK
jgi:hypothetical protein